MEGNVWMVKTSSSNRKQFVLKWDDWGVSTAILKKELLCQNLLILSLLWPPLQEV